MKMTGEQIAGVLAKVQLGDNRDVDELVLAEWHDTIGDLPYADCIEAVRRHRMSSTEYLQPAHIRAAVRIIQREQDRADRVQLAVMGRPPAERVDGYNADEYHRIYRETLRATRIEKGLDPETGMPLVAGSR